MDTPALFDPHAVTAHRARARDEDALFLHKFAASEVSERLKDVNRTFTDAVFIGWQGPLWAKETGVFPRFIPDSDVLDLEPESCDLIVHCLGLHWSNDPVGQLIQMRRALRPDGLMISVMFAGETLDELRQSLTQAEAAISGGISPRVAPMADLRGLGALLQRAGFGLPVADIEPVRVAYETPWHLMRELRAMGEANAMTARGKGFTRRDLFVKMAEVYAQNFCEDGRMMATFELAFLTGWAPSDTQQKPLRPGSATTRLADFLGATEMGEDGEKA
ncbi:methyltransferase domain-containing protein [Amylibacter sp. IMCC11727]|uniref:methyltransferase domain-containing protein n=1 Tax=Amylibacter sp. IMCC11727 TaxID=3039851 RepID=UPI00244E1827|nr:methyltransferase domain-containing protein [Amylibacter sp. IMCC11727]WGI22018.1 SAM-dependent methyltransferase [Amylibacter sp. IMCC11727]